MKCMDMELEAPGGLNLADRIRRLANGRNTIDVAQFQFIGLAEIRERYGAQWPGKRERVFQVARNFIAKRIAPEDVMIPAAEGFLVVFGAFSGILADAAAASGQSQPQQRRGLDADDVQSDGHEHALREGGAEDEQRGARGGHDALVEHVERGLFPPYAEKTRAGLDVFDCRGEPLYGFRYPWRGYERFEDVPAIVAQALLFIENRDLLDESRPTLNPAVDWARFARAALGQLGRMVDADLDAPGGSTLATQIEKYRHSPGGITQDAREKLRQMVSASVRAYREGEQTLPLRRRLVLDYLNTVPLSAAPGHGEVNGLGDGLWVWFGAEFARVNALLTAAASFELQQELLDTAEQHFHRDGGEYQAHQALHGLHAALAKQLLNALPHHQQGRADQHRRRHRSRDQRHRTLSRACLETWPDHPLRRRHAHACRSFLRRTRDRQGAQCAGGHEPPLRRALCRPAP